MKKGDGIANELKPLQLNVIADRLGTLTVYNSCEERKVLLESQSMSPTLIGVGVVRDRDGIVEVPTLRYLNWR